MKPRIHLIVEPSRVTAYLEADSEGQEKDILQFLSRHRETILTLTAAKFDRLTKSI